MATIKDIARLADVGIGTVSRVLNGGDKVKPETAERILQVAENLCYRPNRIAQNLVRRQVEVPTLGLVLPANIRELHWEVLKGIYHYMADHSIRLSAFRDDVIDPSQIQSIVTSNINGLVLLDTPLPAPSLRVLRGARIPCIHLGREVPEQTCISINHTKGGHFAARHLASKGVRSVAFVGIMSDDAFQSDLKQGFREEAIKRSLNIAAEMEVPVGDHEGYKITRILWERGDVHGIFFSTDDLAYGAFRFFREINQGLPIVGYGDMPASRILALSTLRYPSHHMGYKGAESLMAMIRGGTLNSNSQVELIPDLVIRKS